MNKLTQQETLRLITLDSRKSEGGNLVFWENTRLFPGGIQRCFWISDVPANVSRGSHAHWQESQVLVAIHGEIKVMVHQPGQDVQTFVLNESDKGLFIPPLHWVETEFGKKAVLLVLSDQAYSEDDYIRNIKDFESIQEGNH
jgi:dTDP-4-dehydrorhamnose 3,5-epimerase-like enzyme